VPVNTPKTQLNAQGATLRIGTGARFGFIDDPDYFFFNDGEAGLFTEASFSDSIYRADGFPFPHGTLLLRDATGELAENWPFIESLNLGVMFGKLRYNQSISHDFYWATSEILDTVASDHISGSQLWTLLSRYRKLDGGHSRSFGYSSASALGTPLKTVINTIVSDYDFSKVQIDGLGNPGGILNSDLWYQCNEFDFEFLARHADIAVNSNNSPYLTFINLRGEFYFDSLKNLESQKVMPQLRYKMSITPDRQLDTSQIQEYGVVHAGVPFGESVYRSQFYALRPDGGYELVEATPKTSYVAPTVQPREIGTSDRTYMVRNTDLGLLRNIETYGVLDNKNHQKNYEGWMASRHLSALTAHRLRAVVHFNQEAVAGRTMEIDIKGPSGKHSMYAGKWLIGASRHVFTGDQRLLMTQMELVRSGMKINTGTRTLAKIQQDLV